MITSEIPSTGFVLSVSRDRPNAVSRGFLTYTSSNPLTFQTRTLKNTQARRLIDMN